MRVRALIVLAVLAAVVVPASTAFASYPGGSVGHDVSYPQCSPTGASTTSVGSLGGAFGIVGVNNGLPWSGNPCLGAEYAWASGRANAPALYVNTANPAPTSSHYWPTSGSRDPALCTNAASTTDAGCAYDYGWHAAADALTVQAAGLSDATTRTWWLDVETANSWNGNGTSNAADLQGAVDYLRSHGVASVGLYSTSYQWTTITGGYSSSTAAGYASAWAPEFTAQFPMTSAPVWIAGAGTAASAATACGTGFSGGQTQLAQYNDGSGYDADLACGPKAPSAPTALIARAPSGAVALSWSAPASTGGAAIMYRVYRGTASHAESVTPIASGLTSPSYTDTGRTNGTTYFYVVKAVNSAGTSPASNEVSAKPVARSFTLSLSPTSGRAVRGGSVSSAVRVQEVGPAQTVTLSARNVPAGITATFTPKTLTVSGTATMKLAVSSTRAAGTFPITVAGVGTTGTKTATYTLTIG